jgi:predicted exporter
VALAGVSTLLSFGLLGLSATPALRSFGLAMLLGEVTIWLLTPCFRLPPGKDTH